MKNEANIQPNPFSAEANDPAEQLLEKARKLHSDGAFEDALNHAREAAAQGLAIASTQAGVWLITATDTERNSGAGFSLIEEAAKAGEAKAMRLMVNLHAAGEGTKIDWTKAVSWLVRNAKAGDAASMMQIALLLRPQPRLRQLRHTLYYSVAQAGLATASHLLGLDLINNGDAVEHAQGIGWIMAAADAGNPAALLCANDFVGLKMREPTAPQLAKRIPWQDMKRLIQLPHQTPLPAPSLLLETPSVHVRPGFLSRAVSDYLISEAEPLLKPATVHDATDGEISDSSRTNSFVNFRLTESDIISLSVNARIMAAMEHPVRNGDALSLLHYQPGQQYAPHYDFFDPEFPAHQEHLASGGQREKTGLVYLNQHYEGGSTRFDNAAFEFHGQIGDYLQFSNVDKTGAPDRNTLHTGMPPTSGEKWILSKWARSREI